MHDWKTMDYKDRLTRDFDRRKQYEEILLTILNEHQRSKMTPPAEWESLQTKF